ncbi:MAG: NADH-quinone oxidoreductase subunit A [Anaerolineae bacterium]|nr:NADH-quinone oxidoreductase subunit A [Thermoflexales bacterium]MDW8407934.1 NADH-quinone oxidoreductase subunit A [Anaerolineae bacterium]
MSGLAHLWSGNVSEYWSILALFVLSVGLAGLIVLISVLFGPRRRSNLPRKRAPYESGMMAIGPAQRRLPVRFYLVAVLFILFDVEIIFLFSLAAALRDLGWTGFAALFVFVVVLLAGDIWLWKKGAFEWETMDKH